MEPLALFPLQIVAFPRETVNLHIFEERYRELVRQMESDGINFAIPTVIGGALRPIAVRLSLQEVSQRYPGGESDIRVWGDQLLRIDDFRPRAAGQPYPGGTVTPVAHEMDEDPGLNLQILEQTRDIYAALHIDKRIPLQPDGFHTYDIGHHIGLTLEQEYELLTILGAEERQQFILDHLRRVRPDVLRQDRIRDRAKLNGHFRELRAPGF